MKICMAGAYGRMGRCILDLAAGQDDIAIAGAFDRPDLVGTQLDIGAETSAPQTLTLSSGPDEALGGSDVLIDFSVAAACIGNVQAATAAGIPSILGTTGLSPDQIAQLDTFAKEVAVVFAPNMSVGVNLLFKLTSEVASILGLDYNVEIVETHHNRKQDSPSGTAVRLAERAAQALGIDYPADAVHGRQGLVGERPARQIGVHSLRGGDVAGDHTVSFIGAGERLELTHRAHGRENFARGALIAARFAVKAKPGLYDMQDVLGLQ